jgi:hypothetical protein
MNRHVHRKLAELLLARPAEIAHPDPEQAIAFGLLMVDGATREAILFGEAARSARKAERRGARPRARRRLDRLSRHPAARRT